MNCQYIHLVRCCCKMLIFFLFLSLFFYCLWFEFSIWILNSRRLNLAKDFSSRVFNLGIFHNHLEKRENKYSKGKWLWRCPEMPEERKLACKHAQRGLSSVTHLHTFGAHTLTRCTWKRRLKTAAAWTCRHVNGKLKGNLVSRNLVAITWYSNENLTNDKFQRTAEWNKTYIRDVDEFEPNLSCEHCIACTYSVQTIPTGFQ